jgi:4-hydroxy-tetrahydrodipicolinate synthase/2-dehydro-3-deoxy-phosphogluconate/2-dehydro-3-deoxy-6-phosphogalactonate aldolase
MVQMIFRVSFAVAWVCVLGNDPAYQSAAGKRIEPMDTTPRQTAIRGILPTVLTPYDSDERVDLVALEAQVRYLLDAGVHGLVLMGSIGEAPYLNDADREAIIRTTVATTADKVPVLVGITAESTFAAAEQLDQARRLGATAAIVCLPQYFNLKFDDVRRHFERLSERTPLPILYYHYPAATRLALKPSQVAELLALPNMVGIKESSFDMLAIGEQMKLAGKHAPVFLSGSELNLCQFMDLGGHGAISVGAVIMPRTAVAMYEAYQAGDKQKAQELQAQMFETMPLVKDVTAPVFLARAAFLQAIKQGLDVPVGIEPTQARLKAALAARGVPIRPIVRSPLPPLSDRDKRTVEQVMQKIKQIEPDRKEKR